MKTPLVQKVKIQTAQLILKGTLWLAGVAVTLQLLQLITSWAKFSQEILSWVYIMAMLVFFIATWYAYHRLKHSLHQALYLYIAIATIAIIAMLIGFLLDSNENRLPSIVFGLDIGVFILGLILGFRIALRYAYIVTGVSIILSLVAGNILGAVPVVFFAFSMTFPSWLVDRLEKNILESEQKFSLVFQDALDAILIIEKATGHILTINRATTKILGYEANGIIGQPLDPIFYKEAPLSSQAFFETLSTQDELFGSQSFIRADGTRCPMEISATNMQWGEQSAILLTLRDITERKQAEEKIHRYQNNLEELVVERTSELQTSNQELDAFAHTVAHDLKNPLSTLIGFGDLLSKRSASMDTSQQIYACNAITQMGRKMTNIIEELLLFASMRRSDEIPMQPVAMQQVVQGALERVTNLIEDYHPNIEIQEPWPTVWGHPAWIEEIWVNYISNAIKYGGDQENKIPSQVTIGCDRLPTLAAQNTSTPTMRFWVRDNGKGLTLDEQAALFIPFSKLTQIRARGHGLGLSIVHRIVIKLGGETGVISKPGEGSTFYFTLPVNAPEDASLSKAASSLNTASLPDAVSLPNEAALGNEASLDSPLFIQPPDDAPNTKGLAA